VRSPRLHGWLGVALRFLAFFGLFVAVNLLAAHFMSDCGLPAVFGLNICYDDIVRLGWPFQFYEDGGFAYHTFFDNSMLIADLLTGALVSLAAAVLSAAFRRQPRPHGPRT
jgi:hypothetical protein